MSKVSGEEERKFRCTICGRIGIVGRCCGRDTQEVVCKAFSVKDIDLSDLANFPPPPDSDAKWLEWLRSSR